MKSYAEAKLWDADGHYKSSTKRPSGAQLAANLNLCEFHLQFSPLFDGEWILKFGNQLGFDKVITIIWVFHFLGHSVDGTRRAAIDGNASDCCDLWPFDLISMSHVQVHTWLNFGEIYKDVAFNRFFGLLPAVQWPRSLTFDPKSWSAHRLTQIHMWPKLREIPFISFWALRYGVHKVFWSMPAVTLTFNLLS